MSEQSQPSKSASSTAQATAFMRALAASDPRIEIQGKDYLAEIFLDEEQKKPLKDAQVRSWVMQNRLAPGAYEFMLARTAFFDQLVSQAFLDNLPQVVFLGAGYDAARTASRRSCTTHRSSSWIRRQPCSASRNACSRQVSTSPGRSATWRSTSKAMM